MGMIGFLSAASIYISYKTKNQSGIWCLLSKSFADHTLFREPTWCICIKVSNGYNTTPINVFSILSVVNEVICLGYRQIAFPLLASNLLNKEKREKFRCCCATEGPIFFLALSSSLVTWRRYEYRWFCIAPCHSDRCFHYPPFSRARHWYNKRGILK